MQGVVIEIRVSTTWVRENIEVLPALKPAFGVR